MVAQADGGATTDEDLAAIREAAAAWIVCLDEAGPGEREQLHAQCEAWQAVDPRRRRVLAQMRRMWSAVDPARKRRHQRFGALGLLLVVALIGGQLPWNVWTADHRTAAGEIRELELPDGSSVVLNSDSAIDMAYGDGGREIRLQRGELLAIVRADAGERAFRVVTEHGTAAALGTRYGVRLHGDHTMVTVTESRVRLEAAAGRSRVVEAGQRARLQPDRITDVEPAERRRPDWVDGRLVFNDAPLAEVVARLQRHRRGWLMLDGSLESAGLRFTGVVPADDSDAALAVLADALSLRVWRVTPHFAWLRPGE